MRTHLTLTFVAALILVPCVLPAQIEFGAANRVLLGPAINSPSVELLPIVSPDGSTLYFDRKYDSANTGGIGDQDDIWVSTLGPDGEWTLAVNVGPPLNTPGSDVLFWISPDGLTALVFHGDMVRGRPVGMALARKKNGVWDHPVPITIQGLDAFGDSYYGYIAPDQRHLLLSYAPDPARPKDLDLFICTAIGNDLTRWGAPVSLGPQINTHGADGAPFMAADGRTLYFTTNGRPGIGSSDLFVTRRLDSGWSNWSKPENLAGNINTPQFEASLSLPADGQAVYVSGDAVPNDPSYGRSDIYRIPLPKKLQPDPVVLVEGRLVSGGSGVEGLIRAERRSDGREVTATASNQEGRFRMALPIGAEYELTGGARGYDEGTAVLDARDGSAPVANVTIALKRAVGAPPKPAKALLFDVGSADLSADAVAALEQALPSLHAATPNRPITIAGHTDGIGSETDNTDLSRRRAENVRNWLAAHGIDAARLEIEARGESQPVASNGSAAGRALNRRVEVQIPVDPVRPQ